MSKYTTRLFTAAAAAACVSTGVDFELVDAVDAANASIPMEDVKK
jgi:hypothetical protein